MVLCQPVRRVLIDALLAQELQQRRSAREYARDCERDVGSAVSTMDATAALSSTTVSISRRNTANTNTSSTSSTSSTHDTAQLGDVTRHNGAVPAHDTIVVQTHDGGGHGGERIVQPHLHTRQVREWLQLRLQSQRHRYFLAT
jgi:hypothetical protein